MMEQEGKSQVTSVQELIAILTTRIEAADKIQKKSRDESEPHKIESSREQSARFIEELMSELTQFGDGVSGEVNRDNPYQNQWKEVLGTIDEKDAAALLEKFDSMEETLRNFYEQVITSGNDLPLSLQELLQKQSAELSETS